LAFLQREKDSEAVGLLLDHLASARVPGVQAMKGAELFSAVRGLELRDYMLATREVLEVTVWLRRAVQATFVDKKGAAHAAQGT
jgi:CRISPR-associated protein Cmr5